MVEDSLHHIQYKRKRLSTVHTQQIQTEILRTLLMVAVNCCKCQIKLPVNFQQREHNSRHAWLHSLRVYFFLFLQRKNKDHCENIHSLI